VPPAADDALPLTRSGGGGAAPPTEEGPPAFLFDFRDPESYLAAERVLATLPVATPWVPIDSSRLPDSSWGGFRCAADEEAARERIAATAAGRGLQPLRWPAAVPFDSRLALLAAWYAKGIGRVVSYALPAFRQAYAGGHDLSTEAYVLLAASPWNTRSPVQTAGVERTPAASARSVAASSAAATDGRPSACTTARGCISHADAASSTYASVLRSWPPA
jgi:2-hydroxychromene-2-carboxylate isomerase